MNISGIKILFLVGKKDQNFPEEVAPDKVVSVFSGSGLLSCLNNNTGNTGGAFFLNQPV